MHSVQRREKNGSISIKPFVPYFKTNDSWIRKKFWFFPISTSFLTFLLDALSGPVCDMMDIFQAASPLLDRQKAIHKLWVLYKLGTGGIFRLSQLFDIWSHYHIDTFQPLAAFGWRNHLAFLCFHALSPWVSLDWILTGQLGLWKLRGFPSSQLNRMESSSQPTTLRWSNMSRVFNFLFVETTCEGDNSRGKRLRPGLFISAGHRVWHGDYYQHAATFFFLLF